MDAQVTGRVEPGWEPVRAVFEASFAAGAEIGAALSVRHRGQVVVELAGGFADPGAGRGWTHDTPSVCFSSTKGLVATCFLIAQDRGQIDLDSPVADVWPEFGTADKSRVTPRMILNHRAGLSALDAPLLVTHVRDDPERVERALLDQVPTWEPGADQAYAACVFGLYAQAVFRRATGATLGAYLAEHVTGPLGLDAECALGRPQQLGVQPARLFPVPPRTVLSSVVPTALFRDTPDGRMFRRILAGPRTLAGRATLNPSLGPDRLHALNDPALHRMELPWMNAITSARALARVYAALAGDGSVDGVRLVRPERLAPLHGRQSWSERDHTLQKPVGWSQGFLKEEGHLFSRSHASFGHAGMGGSLGWADPSHEIAVGYVMNRMDWRIRSPRALALCHAIAEVVS